MAIKIRIKDLVKELKVDYTTEYNKLLNLISGYFDIINIREPLFLVEDIDLFKIYLKNLPLKDRQYHNCNECKKFINLYGRLVVIGSDGGLYSAMWPDVDYGIPSLYEKSILAMRNAVMSSKVIFPFFSSKKILGTPETGMWGHFSVINERIYNSKVKTSYQYIAERIEDFNTLRNAVGEFSKYYINKAHSLIEAKAVIRSEKFSDQTYWFKKIKDHIGDMKEPFKSNLLWKYVILAPEGFCHIKSSVIGSLIKDLSTENDFGGYTVEECINRFNQKVDPTTYQRPKVVKNGNIDTAENIIEKLNIKNSLDRSYATIDDLQLYWKPRKIELKKRTVGVFDNLRLVEVDKSISKHSTILPGINDITFEKFKRVVIPEIYKLEYLLPFNKVNFVGITTESIPNSEPILIWDTKENRNPVSWYLYIGGSLAKGWNLIPGRFVEVEGICLQPSMWNGNKFTQFGEGVIFILNNARDLIGKCGLGLFPEILKSELHEIRSTIEAYSNKGSLRLYAMNPACGIMLQNVNKSFNHTFKVYYKNGIIQQFKIDRWD